jgi:hypothetical protein
MALIDLKSDLSKFRADFNTPSLENKVNASKYNIDELPAEFSANGARPSKLDTFDYKKEVSMGNSKFAIGTATLINQLGNGSPFRYLKNNALTSKIFSVQGYSSSNTYNSVVASISGQSNKSLLYAKATEQNSPSAIDEEYKKYNLRDEAHNTTYMPQPFILRGIQRKGNETPQYWGFGSRSGFDDGLIRGGVVTVADRIVADTVRIAKFMASPKGLLWIVKQVGLGLTNPKVEAIGGPLTRQTRIHTGVASLLSVPGTALGLHFTRHGIPFANEVASYENVSKVKNNLLTYSIADITGVTQLGNRLIGLRKQLGLDTQSGATLIQQGMPILSLSGLAGPQSVYGIGVTGIRRSTQTISNRLSDIIERNDINPFSITAGYSLNRGYNSSIKFPSNQYLRTGGNPRKSLYNLGLGLSGTPGLKSIYETKVEDAIKIVRERSTESGFIQRYENGKHYFSSLRANTTNDYDSNTYTGTAQTVRQFDEENSNSLAENFKFLNGDSGTENIFDVDLSTSTTRAKVYVGAPATDINSYATLAYGKIPNKDKDKKSLRDFRNEITANDDTKKILGTGVNEGATADYYTKNNLEGRYGFSKSAPIEDTTPLGEKSFKVKGNQFKRSGNRKILSTIGYGGDKVTALDISSGTTKLASDQVYESGKGEDLIKFFFEDGDQGYNVMPFRCTMTGFSDSFSPGWDRIDIMGRPDGAYLYSSFERAISFSFIAAALTRSEMIPMWRKLNYLASYTMPDFNAGGRPSGPFMRITIGDMFQRTPGFLTSLTYSIPDDATWDTASDKDNPDAKQLPMMVEASVSFTIVSDYRPQMMGRVYSLSPGGSKDPAKAGQWLADAET